MKTSRMTRFFVWAVCAVLLLGSGMSAHAEEEPAKVQDNYKIYVNRAASCVTVVTTDEQGNETPVKAMACSCGRAGHETPTGTFKTSNYYEWCLMVDGTYGKYAVRFNKSILFHSVPYIKKSPDTLEWDQYNLLGEPASLGCVRLCVADVKWIYDNCKKGTEVVVYDDAENPGPLGKPETTDIDAESPYRGWDPTDPDVRNPWPIAQLEGVSYENFDAESYANCYADLKEAFGMNKRLLWKHYVEFGQKEGRELFTYPEGERYEDFDAEGYANRYPDVKAAFGTDKGLLWKHFDELGRKEGRTAF